MLPGWLKSFVLWLAGLFVHEAVEQVKEQIETPSTIEDEKIPQPFADALQRDLGGKLRDKNGGR
jgi:hypothetical protein